MKNWKINIEEFFEKHNAKIQIVIFAGSLGLGAYFNIAQDNQLGIIIGLLLLIAGELISLSIKDSITQRKLNNMGVKFEMARGGLVRVHDFDLSQFFKNTKSHFFISGMALNGFFQKNKGIIERFLNEGKEIFILIAAPNAVDENAKLYHGENLDLQTFRKKANAIYHKQSTTLDCLEEIENLFNFVESGKLKLRVAQSVMSTSFVAYDVFEREILTHNKNKVGKELKASFYQYKCTAPEEEPNIIVDSFYNRDWYLFFRRTIEMQWNDAKPIKNKQEFEELRKAINEKIDKNNNCSHDDNKENG